MKKKAGKAKLVDAGGKDRLLQAAIRLFGRRGYNETSIRRIAREAKVSIGLIRFHFGSKEGLRKAAEQQIAKTYLGLIQRASEVTSLEQHFDELDQQRDLLATFEDSMLLMRRAILDERPVAMKLMDELYEMACAMADAELGSRAEPPDEETRLWVSIHFLVVRASWIVMAPYVEKRFHRKPYAFEDMKARNRAISRFYSEAERSR